MTRYFTADEVRRKLQALVEMYPTASAAAADIGVTRGHLSRVLRGEKKLDGKVLKWAGFDHAQVYIGARVG